METQVYEKREIINEIYTNPCYFLSAEELCKLANIHKTKAYEIIKETNKYLEGNGNKTIKGQAPAKVVMKMLGVEL